MILVTAGRGVTRRCGDGGQGARRAASTVRARAPPPPRPAPSRAPPTPASRRSRWPEITADACAPRPKGNSATFLNNAGPHALPLVRLPRPVHRLRRRRSRLQVSHGPAPQTSRHALDHRRRRRHHRPALRKGQQPAGSHLQHPAHSDTNRLTSPGPKMILVTYKNDVHPSSSGAVRLRLIVDTVASLDA